VRPVLPVLFETLRDCVAQPTTHETNMRRTDYPKPRRYHTISPASTTWAADQPDAPRRGEHLQRTASGELLEVTHVGRTVWLRDGEGRLLYVEWSAAFWSTYTRRQRALPGVALRPRPRLPGV
jgi:hypothetical protein